MIIRLEQNFFKLFKKRNETTPNQLYALFFILLFIFSQHKKLNRNRKKKEASKQAALF
jgi:hypothetical protein